jgi:hypothetical protein
MIVTEVGVDPKVTALVYVAARNGRLLICGSGGEASICHESNFPNWRINIVVAPHSIRMLAAMDVAILREKAALEGSVFDRRLEG